MTQTSTQSLALEDRTLGHLMYGLMASFPLLLMPVMLGLLINLSQKQTATSLLIASHLRWQRHAILGFLGCLCIGYMLPQVWLSVTLYLLACGWFCHRIIKGWLSLLDGRVV